MTAVMSTSLKVVSMAAVFCASLRRLAMVRRSRVMRTRSSRSARGRGPAGAAGFAAGALARAGDRRQRRQHVGLGGAAVLAGGLDADGGDARSPRRACASPDRTPRCWRRAAARQPATGAGVRRRRRSRRQASARPGPRPAGAAAAAGFAAAAGAARFDDGRARRPTWTVAPSATARSTMRAGRRAFTSTVTLSVSSSHNGWSIVDRVARLHHPFGDGRLGDRFAQCRDLDLDGHD